jgi:hypothetical protein
MCHLVKALLGAGWSDEEICRKFRSMYDRDVTDSEIWAIIRWGKAHNPTPYVGWKGTEVDLHGFGYLGRPINNLGYVPQLAAPSAREIANATSIPEAIQNLRKYLDGCEPTLTDLSAALYDVSSPRPGKDFRKDASLVIDVHYHTDEYVCQNVDFRLKHHEDGSLATTIVGPGLTHKATEWRDILARSETPPQSAAGAWIRLNPVTQTGSGAKGTHTNNDVTAYRFILVEFDVIPLKLQLAILASLPWPVAMIVSSGGKSFQAWLLSECDDRQSFDRKVEWIYRQLAPFKLDCGNGNPSRYGRLPGALRKIGARGRGLQKIFYLNLNPKGGPIL